MLAAANKRYLTLADRQNGGSPNDVRPKPLQPQKETLILSRGRDWRSLPSLLPPNRLDALKNPPRRKFRQNTPYFGDRTLAPISAPPQAEMDRQVGVCGASSLASWPFFQGPSYVFRTDSLVLAICDPLTGRSDGEIG